jgi:hypothetical protein
VSDNLSIAGSTIATDEVTIGSTSVHAQRVKLGFGDDGTYIGDVSRSVPLPVDAALRSDVIQNSGSQLTPKFAVINKIVTGTVVAAVAGKKIRVLSLFMTIDVLTGDEEYTFKSGAAGSALTGTIGAAGGAGTMIPISYGFSPVGHFETVAGELLELKVAGTTPFAEGSLVYVEV